MNKGRGSSSGAFKPDLSSLKGRKGSKGTQDKKQQSKLPFRVVKKAIAPDSKSKSKNESKPDLALFKKETFKRTSGPEFPSSVPAVAGKSVRGDSKRTLSTSGSSAFPAKSAVKPFEEKFQSVSYPEISEEEEEMLRQFDMNGTYGACRGISRRERFERAINYNLQPPPSDIILHILDSHDELCNFSLWDQPASGRLPDRSVIYPDSSSTFTSFKISSDIMN